MKKLYYKLKEIFEILYLITTFISGFIIVCRVENDMKVGAGLIAIYIISTLLTACKIYFTAYYKPSINK